MSENDIREELRELLVKEPLDYDRIMVLTNELALQDPNGVRFSVDANLINRLGTELVARQETALSELVKNAYDADAKKVKIQFVDTDEIGGMLIIDDDGTGMDRDQLVDGFMRISSNMKKEKPVSDIYKRKKAGRKGIGRFAVQRLGNKLQILTKTPTARDSFEVMFEWRDYQATKNINEISNEINIVSPHTQNSGTRLIISDLKDRWSEAAIKRVYRYLEDVLQPVSEFNENEGKGEFAIEVIKIQNGRAKDIQNDLLKIDNYAVAIIKGGVDERGMASISIDSKRLGLYHNENLSYDVNEDNKPFGLLRNVKVKAYYFIENYMPRGQKTAIQNYLRLYGGIRLYRNGFRVLPYGEPTNDWLKLDFSLRQRSILPQHGNNNFRGVVNIDDTSGMFEETSSREGLFENETFIQLQNFVYRALLTAVVRIAKERNVKITTSQKKVENRWADVDVTVKNIAYSIDELDRAISANQPGSIIVKQSKELLEKTKKELERLKAERKEERKRIREEQTLLRVLSSVGLTTEQFVHEIKYYLHSINNDIDFLKRRLEKITDVAERIGILERNFANFNTYVSYFDAMVAGNVNRALAPCEMRNIVRPFIEAMQPDATKSGLKFDKPIFSGYNLYTVPMHPSEWTSILFNFYTNSKKAIKRARERDGRILIMAGKEDGKIFLEFSDNGDGIPVGDEEKIFERFYTTTAQTDIDHVNAINNVTGSGLGLTIVKDICTSNNGSVFLVNPTGKYSTCFRVEIPALTDKEIDNL